MPNPYKTISKKAEGLFKDRGSKFTGYIHPISSKEEAEALIKTYKEEQPDARHHCFAYRIGPDGKEYRAYDDGEPSGTAGKPILNQLLSHELTNVLVVVIRYSSGTKLGVPGLINAYKEATIAAINESEIIEKAICKHYKIRFNYDQLPEVMKWSKQQKVEFINQVFDLNCFVEFGIDSREADNKLANLPRTLKAEFLIEA